MIFGLPLEKFTLLHVGISLVAILSGLAVLAAMLGNRNLRVCTALFLATSLLTSVTGFLYPGAVDPARIVGVISLVALAAALVALYQRRLAGSWRIAYIVTAVLALYLNCFVAVTQAFGKVPALANLAPTQSSPVFLGAQAALLVAFLAAGVMAVARFHPKAG
jgi:hypothetical protein